MPYHAPLAAELERVHARHGYAMLLDGHSIRREVPRFFAGRLPDLNLGTADGASCAPGVQALRDERARAARGDSRTSSTAASRAATSRATTARPRAACTRCSSRWRRRATWTRRRRIRWDAARAAPLGAVLARLVDALLAVATARWERVIRSISRRNRFDAYLLADRLKQAGIRAHVFNEHASSIVGEVPPDVAQPQVWLEREQDRERATCCWPAIEADAAHAAETAALRGSAARSRRRIVRSLLEVRRYV